MKLVSAIALGRFMISSSSMAQNLMIVRGIGTQTCAKLLAADKSDSQFEMQATQWVLGYLTGYFRQAADDQSRAMGDVMLVQIVFDVCNKNAEKTIDEADQCIARYRCEEARRNQINFVALLQSRGEIVSSRNAIRSRATGSLSPSWADRRMVSAIDLICVELTG